MRTITSHKVNPVNDKIDINVLDEPGDGGANHLYQMKYPSRSSTGEEAIMLDHIKFQKGPIAEAGVNGVTQEVLIAICVDRLKAFQAGPFACRENALALTKLEEAQHWLFHRTQERMARGVEGTHEK